MQENVRELETSSMRFGLDLDHWSDAIRGIWRRVRISTPSFILIILLFLMFIPILVMLSMSLRRTAMIYADFWQLPFPPYWANYHRTLLDLMPALYRSIYLYLASILGTLFFCSLSSYSFARHNFPGSTFLFYVMVLIVMMVPGALLLAPNFALAQMLGLRGKLWGVAVTYIAFGQPFAIFLTTTFFQSQPEEMFESARMDGASEWQTLWCIAMPLARPILVTIAILNFNSIYGDLIWPSLMLHKANDTMMMALLRYSPQVDEHTFRPQLGPISAAYVFSAVVPLIIFLFGMRYFIAGLTSGAIKG